MPESSLFIRPSLPGDLATIRDIYAHSVSNGASSFELEPPDLPEMARRRDAVLGRGWPWLVAQAGGQVVGYAYADVFRPRPAYRFTVEDSIYLDPQASRRGIGRMLLAELVARCAQRGARQMLAVIGDSASRGSIELHRGLGFEPCGLLRDVGWKVDRWRDVVLMQRELAPGAAQPAGESA